MSSQKHIHRYYKVKIGDKKREVLRCSIDNCSHILYNPELGKFRKTICWGCGEVFELGAVILFKPVCNKCTEKRKRLPSPEKIDKAVDTLLEQFSSPEALLKALERK